MIDSDPVTTFAARLKALRTAQGLSQEELGHRSGIYWTDVSRYEREQREPGIRALAKLANGLGIPLPELVRFEEESGGEH